jgi:hypothetical protein
MTATEIFDKENARLGELEKEKNCPRHPNKRTCPRFEYYLGREAK